MRLTGGEHRGRLLAVPSGARPTEARVREALFSIWGPRLAGARVLDLFAGSGAVGIEAAGRGALAVLCVDEDPRGVKVLAANLAKLGEGLVEVRRAPLPAGLARLAAEGAGPFDLVFADPPYRFPAYREVVAGVEPLLAADGELAVEHSARQALEIEVGGLVRVDVRRYGESAVSFYRRGPA